MTTHAQHHAVSANLTGVVEAASRPQPGPIAVIPPTESFIRAARAEGAEVAPLSDATRAIIWLTNDGSAELGRLLQRFPAVEWIQLPFAGVDQFATLLKNRSVHPLPLWTSAKGAYAQPVAEHALTLVLALLRVLPARVRATSWATGVKRGTSLFGLSIVIIGAGGIAIELIRLLAPFGVRITIVRRTDVALPSAQLTVGAERLADVLPDADVVIIAAAATRETSRMIGAAELALMKNTAVLVNIARGSLIDTDALATALASGALAGAGLDVTSPEPLPDGHPLWSEPNVIITPHCADTPSMTAPLLAERIRQNVQAFLGDGRFVGVVDTHAGY